MRLKQIIAAAGVSQKKVADDLGMSIQAINNYVQEKREPDISTLIKLADYFNVTVDYLIGRDVPDEKAAVGQIVELDPSKPVVLRAGEHTFEIHLAEEKE